MNVELYCSVAGNSVKDLLGQESLEDTIQWHMQCAWGEREDNSPKWEEEKMSSYVIVDDEQSMRKEFVIWKY